MFGRVSSGFLRWLGFGTQTCFWGEAFGGSSNTPSLTIGSIGLGGVILINLGVVEGFSLGFKHTELTNLAIDTFTLSA
jgi:hypothetical protein